MTPEDGPIRAGTPLDLAALEVLDWYDGPTEALIRLRGESAHRYARLVHVGQPPRDRTYALVPLPPEAAATILDDLRRIEAAGAADAGLWDRLRATIETTLRDVSGPALLVELPDMKGPVTRWKPLSAAAFRDLMEHHIDDALAGDRPDPWAPPAP